jgi:hypothetical protein
MNIKESGNILFSFLITKILILTCTFFYFKVHLINQEIYRSIELYKCEKELSKRFKQSINKILKLNTVIKSLNLLEKIPKYGQAAKITKKTLMIYQEVIWVNYLKGISSIKACFSCLISSYLSSKPLKRNLYFSRNKNAEVKKSLLQTPKVIYSRNINGEIISFWKIGKKLKITKKIPLIQI